MRCRLFVRALVIQDQEIFVINRNHAVVDAIRFGAAPRDLDRKCLGNRSIFGVPRFVPTRCSFLGPIWNRTSSGTLHSTSTASIRATSFRGASQQWPADALGVCRTSKELAASNCWTTLAMGGGP